MNDNTAGAGAADDTAPPVPEEIAEAARLAPDHWLGMVDPAWPGEGEPPDWAVVGRWRSGQDGEIEEWRPNEEYRPSPQALGWPAPTDPVDEAVQLAATGYGPGEAVSRTLAVAEVAVLLAPGGGPLSATSPDGAAVVPVFTSPTYLHAAGRFGYELAPVHEVVDRIPEGHVLYLNPSGPVGMAVETDALRQAVEAAARSAAERGDEEAAGEAAASPAAGGADLPTPPVTATPPGARTGGGTGPEAAASPGPGD
ncbi:type VII secretion system-associated protein [Streptomyces sp. NPDC017201]|uniref:type VII secretion system-associated protein n=1 Tax=unclassified Streptomyces TaxID=2593676 RepID=UPI002E372219|nr:type VII secretion system-associated protein [Streptomyces sp. NBC_01708]